MLFSFLWCGKGVGGKKREEVEGGLGVGGFLVAGGRVGFIRRYFGGFGEWGGGLGGGEDCFIAVWPLIVLGLGCDESGEGGEGYERETGWIR